MNKQEPDRIVVPFKISRSGHQVVIVTFKGKPMRLVIDSAAGANVVDIDSAERLGIKAIGKRKDTSGLGTSSHKTINLTPFKVFLGDAAVVLEAIGLDLKHVKSAGGKGGLDGLLGAPFLISHRATIDFQSKSLSFTRSAQPKKTSPRITPKADPPKATPQKAVAKKIGKRE